MKPDRETGKPSDCPSMSLKITTSSLPCFSAAMSVSASGHGVAQPPASQWRIGRALTSFWSIFKPIPGGRIDSPDDIREFKFQPAFGMRMVNLLEAGSIAGLVTDDEGNPLAGAAVSALDGDEEVTSTSTEDDGTYVLYGLPTGEYSVEASATGFESGSAEAVEVQAGEQTPDVNFELAPADDGGGSP